MESIKSSEFRKTFARLTEPTAVTVNGHMIGFWQPMGWDPLVALDQAKRVWDNLEQQPGFNESVERGKAQIAAGDSVRFNTQPFRGPIPKSGKAK